MVQFRSECDEQARDLVKTPLGLVVTVLGVKYETKLRGEIGTGVLWVEYPNRFPAPLEKDMKGYTKLSDGMHLWRDLAEMNAIKEEEENVRAIIDDDNDKYAAELIAENEKKKKK
ncbi:hypothetical protein M758_12G091100 [Ceratodon purpureus]|nr:hypothetical protein M758_12G091100 [Ceratodon purpureus]